MLGSKWNRWLLVGGAALGALAAGCGSEDDPAPAQTFDGGTGAQDSGSQPGLDSGQVSQCTTYGGVSGMACTLGDGGLGYVACVNGVPGSGPCMSLIPDGGIASFFDGGLPFDASGLIPDGGFGDGGVGGACPTGFTCADPGDALGSPVGLKVCGKPENIVIVMATLPPVCTAAGSCMVDGLTGTCQSIPLAGMRCFQPCQ